MGVFDDHKLERLDWMTSMTETIESDLNVLLAKLPDRTLITVAHILESNGSSYLSLSVRNVLSKYKELAGGDTFSLSWAEDCLIDKCFSFECVGEPEFDLRSESINNGQVFLVKTTHTFSDEDLQPLMGARGIEVIGRIKEFTGTSAPLDRMNDILDMLGGCQEHMKNRSGKKKLIAIKNRLRDIFKTNEWRIRDMTLANKIGFWIRGYIANGNLADLTNFTKLKVMTHNNMPIYSVKEEV